MWEELRKKNKKKSNFIEKSELESLILKKLEKKYKKNLGMLNIEKSKNQKTENGSDIKENCNEKDYLKKVKRKMIQGNLRFEI